MIYVKNEGFLTYEPEIRALINSFYPGQEIVLNAGKKEDDACGAYLDIDKICAGVKRLEPRFEDKTRIKHAVYGYLKSLTDRELPWGNLTGIRPIKIMEMYDSKGVSKDELFKLLKADMDISDSKLELAYSIYRHEKEILCGTDYKNGFSIYIGIPFCPTRCVYCSFTSYPFELWKDRIDDYLICVKRELEMAVRLMGDPASALYGRQVKTIYIGGGTPSVLSAEMIDRLFGIIYGLIDRDSLLEVTFEAGRPDTIDTDKLKVLKSAGNVRISINPQSMNQKTLDLIGRKHTKQDVEKAFYAARALDFNNINMDVIAGLPGEGIEEFTYTLDEIGKLDPECLTVHTLAVKRASKLNTEGNAWGGMVRKGIGSDSFNELECMVELGKEYALNKGMLPYYLYRQKNMAGSLENTGYAKSGKENLYNILMMEEKHTVIGIGAGSSTKLVRYAGKYAEKNAPFKAETKEVRRFENVKDIDTYLKKADELINRKEEFLRN